MAAPLRLQRLYRRFAASTRGVAAIEFAMIAPVLAVMFLASFDGGRAIAAYMKLRAATYALASITNQYSTIQSTDMTSIVGATGTVMAPYTTTASNPVITISQITISSKGKATISWSYSQGGTARAQGSSITLPSTALQIKSSYLILAEVSYTFTPVFGLFSSAAMTFSDNLYVTPRISNCINYPPESVSGCITG
jgi:Flp pilus assembly protein TadG